MMTAASRTRKRVDAVVVGDPAADSRNDSMLSLR